MQLGARPVHTESKLQSLWAADGEATTKKKRGHMHWSRRTNHMRRCAMHQFFDSIPRKAKHNEQPGHRGRNLIERFMAGNTALPLSQRIE